MYVAVKGGEKAIAASHKLIAEERRGDQNVPALTIAQIKNQMQHAVDRVMTEGSLYDEDLAALAIKQAQGDLVEAIFLVRAFRSTLPRFGATEPIKTDSISARRRISAAFKDIPGGQILGPTYDYTHRLLDFTLAAEQGEEVEAERSLAPVDEILPQVFDTLDREGLIENAVSQNEDTEVFDLTRSPMSNPADRDQRLQNLARGDEGFLLAMGYSTQRGYGGNHPFAGEIRLGEVPVEFEIPELGFSIEIGEITVTECQMINQFGGTADQSPKFTRGYGLAFGTCERKTMAMALVDRALRADEFSEARDHPAQDEEFVMSHSDNVEASGFVQHLKLPHYIDFQSELQLIRSLKREFEEKAHPEAAE